MGESIRVYEGNRVRSYSLEHKEQFLAAAGQGADHMLSPADCAGQWVRFVKRPEGWRMEHGGALSVNGAPVRDRAPAFGALYVLNGPKHIAVQPVREELRLTVSLKGVSSFKAGRSASCELSLSDPMVSGIHAVFERRESGWHIQDRSTNGTYVNGVWIKETDLSGTARILMGSFRLELKGDSLTVYGGEKAGSRLKKADERPAGPGAYPWFTRSPRLRRSRPSGELEIEAAPSIGAKPEINWVTTLVPGLGGVAVMAVLIVAMGMSPISLAMSGSMAVLGIIMAVYNYKKQSSGFEKTEENRRLRYNRYLADCEARLREAAEEQRRVLTESNPSPAECLSMAVNRDRSLWGRLPSEDDFLCLRTGMGAEPFCLSVRTPHISMLAEEDEFSRRPEKLAKQYAMVPDVPVLADLMRFPSLGIAGPRADAIQAVYGLVIQAASHHSYDELKLAVLFPSWEEKAWSWMRWLPHTFDDSRSVRYMADGSFESASLLEELEKELARRASERPAWGSAAPALPHYLFIVADPSLLRGRRLAEYLLKNDPSLGVSCIFLGESLAQLPKDVTQILETGGGRGVLYTRAQAETRREFAPDLIGRADCERFARSLAPVRLMGSGNKRELPSFAPLLDCYHVSKTDQLDIEDFWANTACERTMAVPIGVREDGSSFYFDIHETAHGPHGLVAGTSGSGKSEMAQTWIISMALQFSPEDVNFILVDFKGTSLLTPFRNLPHLAGSISNLDRDIRRSLLSIDSEMERRQRLLDHYGISDINGYLARRRKDPSMEPMPHLMLVFDEFAEFKTQFPEFSSVLDHVFRGGRSLGVHSVLMTQKPSGVVTDQMKANANFSWCLKVQTEADSREVLGTGDAAYIRNPGRSYVKCGDGTYQLIQSYYAGAPYLPGGPGRQAQVSAVSLSGRRRPVKGTGNRQGSGMTQLEALTACIADYCRRKNIPPARRIWTEKLPEKKELFDLTGGPWKEWREEEPGAVQAVLGLVDDPARQRQEILSHDFWEKGHLLLYGMPLSGRTTFLQTMLISLACRYTPAQVQFYMLEFNGYGLRAMETFPHVGAAAGSDEPEELRQIAGLLEKELDRRKKAFRRLGAGSISAYLEAGGTEAPTWVVLADNLNLARESFPDIYACMVRISREGAACGIYLACSILGTESGSYQLSPNIKTVLTLQQPDRLDYTSLVGRAQEGIPESFAGRGLVKGPLEFQTAIAFAELSDGKRVAALRKMAGEMSAAWKGERPKGIAVMPERIPFGTLEGAPFILGLSYEKAEPVSLPAEDTESILLSVGDPESPLFESLLLQAAALPGADVFLCSENRACPGPCRAVRSAGELDEAALSLAQELRGRQERKKKDPSASFPPVVVMIDGLRNWLDSVKPDTISRLEVFIRLGKGLGITIIAADTAENIAHCYYSNDILTATMREGAVVLCGGAAGVHRITDTIALEKRHPEPFKEDDLVLASEGFRKIRSMTLKEE